MEGQEKCARSARAVFGAAVTSVLREPGLLHATGGRGACCFGLCRAFARLGSWRRGSGRGVMPERTGYLIGYRAITLPA